MKTGVKIMSTGSGFTDSSIMVSVNNTKYCFNMGNGIHRQSLGSSHSRPADADVLFYSHLGPSAQADLLNYILRHKTDISIIGPVGLTENLLGYRYFFSRRSRSFYITECSSQDEQYSFNDGILKVFPIIIQPNQDSNNNIPITNTNEFEEKNIHENILKELNSRKELNYMFDKVFGPVVLASKESMRVNTDSMKSFYDWTLLRGGYLYSSTGSQFKMEEIEQYGAYRLLKEDNKVNGRSNVDISQYKPKRSKEIKKFLLDTNDSDQYQAIPATERENDYWCLESRHFRIISRLPKFLRLNDLEKREMTRKRMNIYLKDSIYGPVNSHAILPPNVIKSSSSYSSSPLNSPSKSNMNSNNNNNNNNNNKSFKDLICYICLLPDIIGKFSVDKANEFGIVGSGRSKLCKGESVFSEKVGRLIKPEDVLSPSTIGPAIIIISCPRIEYLQSILNNSSIRSFSSSERSGCIVHMVSEEIFSLPEYCDFVTLFSNEKWQHIVLNESCAYHELTIPSAQLVNGLNEVAPIFYPKLYPYSQQKPLPSYLSKLPNIQRGRFHQTIMLNPLSPLGHPLFDNSACIENISTNYSFEKKSNENSPSKKLKSLDINSSSSSSVTCSPRSNILSNRGQFLKNTLEMIGGFSETELEVVFLGTGCSQTSLFREETCILLNLFEKGSMMFDVGGGAYSQLYRKYGKEETDKILIGLKFVFLSHLHVDHHQGLYKLLEMRHLAMEESYIPYEQRQIIVLAPQGAHHYIRELEKTMTFYNYPWKYVSFYNFQNYNLDKQLSTFMKQRLGISKCIAVPVIHNFNAHGIVVESENGWKVSYSGDTKYCEKFVEASKDSTILIHEATFHDHQNDKAQAKSHSTYSEAIKAYRSSNSYSTILTHFSQRYPNLQETLSGDLNDDSDYNNITFAFDFLTVNIKNLNLLIGSLDSLKIDPAENEEVDDLDEI